MALKLPSVAEPKADIQSLLKCCQDLRQLAINAGLAGAQAIPWDTGTNQRLPGIRGCVPSNSTGDATNDLNFTEGWIVDTDGFSWHQPAFSELRLDAGFSQGDKGGLLDAPQTTAGVGNNSYHIFAIYSEKTGKAAYVASRQTRPVLPGDYNRHWRACSIYRSGGANILFSAKFVGGDLEFLLNTPVTSYSSTNPGTGRTLRTMNVPTGIQVEVFGTFHLGDTGGGARTTTLAISSPDQSASPTIPQALVRANVEAHHSGEFRARTDTSGRIYADVQAVSDASVTEELGTNGWIERRRAV